MGNANGRGRENRNGDGEYSPGQCHGRDFMAYSGGRPRSPSMDSIENSTPPESPGRSCSPFLFAPQVPVAPLPGEEDVQPVFNQPWTNCLHGPLETPFDGPLEQGIPTMITWNYGGKDVTVEGSWDNWTSRTLQRSGKDHSILLVLPCGVYQYRFIVDGEWRYIPDLPCITDEVGHVTNLLDVRDCMPENLESVAEFEPPTSPDTSYGQPFPLNEDFTKDPFTVPSQLQLTILGMQAPPEATSSLKPQHVVLNHVFIEKGWAPHSLVALGLTHRFQSKYITVVLYKPLRR